MRTITIVLLFFFGQLLCAQNESVRKYAISVDMNRPIAFGNNFFNKAYDDQIGFGINLQRNFKYFFVEFNYQNSSVSISKPELIGNFQSSDGECFDFIAGFRQFLSNTSYFMEYKIGMGTRKIYNYSTIGNYNNSATNFLIGTRVNKKIGKHFIVFGNIDLNYSSFVTNNLGPYDSFYGNAYQFIPSVGLKLPFGRFLNDKKLKYVKKHAGKFDSKPNYKNIEIMQ